MRTVKNTALFLSKIDRRSDSECWPWIGHRDRKGYGWYCMGFAHRKALVLFTGSEIPPGMCVLHSCDNPPCCNPAHLRIGTVSDNSQDMVARGRCARATAKVSVQQARDIVTMRGMGYRNGEIAPLFGITNHAVSMILARARKRKH